MGKFDLRILLCIGLIAQQFQDSAQIKIKKQTVPSLVEAGKTEFVILDCDYDIEGNADRTLVVKWFLNEALVYQWIYNSIPQSTFPLNKFIDLNYKASEDPAKMYRAMKLVNPSTELSGEYTCTVFNSKGEATEKKSMIVYSTEDKFDLVPRKIAVNGTDGVEVTCVAEGLFPRPALDVSVKELRIAQSSEVTQKETDKKYTVRTRVEVTDASLPYPAQIICALAIPDANYTVSKMVIYYPGASTTTTTTTTTTSLQRKMDLQAPDNSQQDTDNGGGSSARSISDGFIMLVVSVTVGTAFLF